MNYKEKYWSRFAGDFEKRNSYVIGGEDLDRVLEKVASQKDLKRVLEIGCGDGVFTKMLAPNSESVLATDLSEEMVKAASQRLSNLQNVRIEQADGFNLSYPEMSFDTVFIANLIHVVPYPELIIRECKKVLKSNGRLIILTYTNKEMKLKYRIGLIYRYLKTYGAPPEGVHNYRLKEAESFIKEQGFNVTESGLIGIRSKAIYISSFKKT